MKSMEDLKSREERMAALVKKRKERSKVVGSVGYIVTGKQIGRAHV